MIDSPKDTNSAGLYAAAIGEKNQAYYLDKFEQFDANGTGFHISWNWAALFGAGGVWALYRKMYGWFFATWAFGIILNMVMKLNPPPVVGLLYLAPWFYFAIFGNSLYHRKVRAQIASAQKLNADEHKIIKRLNASGGVHAWVLYVVGAIPVIGIVAAIAIPAYENTAKAKFDASTAKLTVEAPPIAEPVNPYGQAQPSATPNSQTGTFVNQPPKANPFDQFDEKSSQTLAPEHLAKREIILEKLRLNELLKINGVTTAVTPQNAILWSTSSTLDLERNQTPWRTNKTQFNTHIVNKTQINLSGIGFDFKESACSDSAKSNRFFVNLERPINSGSAAVVTFMMPESLVSKGGNFCLDIVSAWH